MVRGCCRLAKYRGFSTDCFLMGSAIGGTFLANALSGDPTAVAPCRGALPWRYYSRRQVKWGDQMMSTRMHALERIAGGTMATLGSLRGAGGLAVLAGISILCLAQVSRGRQQEEKAIRAKVVVAESFALDSLGHDTKVSFGVHPAPGAALNFAGGQGSRVLLLSSFGGTPTVWFARSVGKTTQGMMLFLPNTGSPQIVLKDQQTKLQLNVLDKAVPSVTFLAADRDRMSLSAGPRPVGPRPQPGHGKSCYLSRVKQPRFGGDFL